MFPLKHLLAEYGFESRDDYDYAIQCFLNNPGDHIRYLNVDGDPGRRKTAFAHALGQALNYDHVLYFEFGVDRPQPQVVRLQDGEELPEEPPTQPFDRIMTEACALSEADKTVLILDQLRKAEFQQHIRLYEFSKNKVWTYSDAKFYANPQNLLIFLVSAEPLYHSLQQHSYRVWVRALPDQLDRVQPEELGLDEACRQWLDPLNSLLNELGVAPSMTEYGKLAYDIQQFVRSEEQLKTSIFGWVENVDRARLHSVALQGQVAKVMRAIEDSLGIQEEIELSSAGSD